jgi:hypothetical protein
MPALSKFNQFPSDLLAGVHAFASHTVKVLLTNTAPVATNAVKADLTEIGAGNGYSSGGATSTVSSYSQSGGVAKLVLTDVTWTASGGSIGPFRYAVIYNDTPTSPADPLVGWVDYGAARTLGDGESFTVDFSASNGALTIG